MCWSGNVFSLSLCLPPTIHIGQERQQSAPVILVMISLQRAIASHALFNKGTFEVHRWNLRQSFHMLPVHYEGNQTGEKRSRGNTSFFELSTLFILKKSQINISKWQLGKKAWGSFEVDTLLFTHIHPAGMFWWPYYCSHGASSVSFKSLPCRYFSFSSNCVTR